MCAAVVWYAPRFGPRRNRCLLRGHAFGRLFDQRGDRGGLGHIDGVTTLDLVTVDPARLAVRRWAPTGIV